jgi:hypothetical protein
MRSLAIFVSNVDSMSAVKRIANCIVRSTFYPEEGSYLRRPGGHYVHLPRLTGRRTGTDAANIDPIR